MIGIIGIIGILGCATIVCAAIGAAAAVAGAVVGGVQGAEAAEAAEEAKKDQEEAQADALREAKFQKAVKARQNLKKEAQVARQVGAALLSKHIYTSRQELKLQRLKEKNLSNGSINLLVSRPSYDHGSPVQG